MPILTPTEERANYQLYPGKPCVSHAAEGCVSCLKLRIQSVGKTLKADGSWSDPPHFKNPVRKNPRATSGHEGKPEDDTRHWLRERGG